MAKKGSKIKRKYPDFLDEEGSSSKHSLSWVEQFTPSTVDDLAVHKKKVSEVQTWFLNFFSPKSNTKVSPILLLTGPPGVGKTATVQTICTSLKAELFIWSNTHQEKFWKPDDIDLINSKSSFKENENQTMAFTRFLLHSTKYSLFSSFKKVILIEEFPNALVRHPEEFHFILRKFFVNGRYPAVFVISDNVKGDSEETRLFPKELQCSLHITNISFNPVAPTMLLKVLNRINCSSQLASICTKLNKSQLESIVSDSKGDVRNAVNSMQFFCMAQNDSSTSKRPSQTKESDKPTSKRDSSLFLFHALGKILYCKRDMSLKSVADTLPTHLKKNERDPLLSNAEEVFEHTSISADGFNLFLQENYLSFIEDMDVAAECSVSLSEADALSAFWSGREVLSDYAVSVASRGLMFNIVSCSTGKRWKPLHKPQFYENNSKKNRFTNSLKWTFKGSSLSLREMQIDMIPFIPKLLSKDFNPGQVSLAKEIGEMNVKRIARQMNKTLDEKDCFEQNLSEAEIDFEDWSSDEKDLDDAAAPPNPSDEEIIIEDYDF